MSLNVGNPFESTQPARQYFVGRSSELSALNGYLETVRNGGATNLYIVGGGGDGKTSFLYKIKEEAAGKSLITALVTVSDGMEPEDVIYQLIEKALDEIAKAYQRKEYYDDFQLNASSTLFRTPILRESNKSVTPSDLERDLEFLLRTAQQLGATGIVFCLDEGQRLKHIKGGALFAVIRAAIQAIGHGYMIVLAALEDIIPSIAEGYTGIDRFFPNVINLGAFENVNVAVAAINTRLQGKSVAFPQEISELIAKISDLRPKNIIDICHDLYADALTSSTQEVSQEMIHRVVYQRYSDVVKSTLKQLGELRPNDQNTLRKIMHLGDTFTARDVAQLYCQTRDEDCISRMEGIVSQDLRILTEKGICVSDGNQKQENYRIAGSLVGYVIENELGR
jgi:hypothetical protein